MTNREIADALDRVADLLAAQDANPFRVSAYRRAAGMARVHPEPLAGILHEGGREALEGLPTIGGTMAAHVSELVHRGQLTLLDRLEGEVSPERLLTTVGGIGPELARRIHDELGLESLEELEQAAHDGRLDGVAGFGPRRLHAVREQLASILARQARGRARRRAGDAAERRGELRRPDVGALLAVDAEYRDRSARGALRRIAPRRFNPGHEAWLPILHTERDGWHVTALFSNTARAHELGRTRDWVVLFYECDGDAGQCTVVTETRGPLRGRRVVRGRESECARLTEPHPGHACGREGAPPTGPALGSTR